MNTLGYAILGLIDKQKITGYDLTKIFNDSIADFWSAKQSQIYPELKKMVDAGLIEYETVIQGEVLEKKVYSITEQGKKKLQQWMLEEEPPVSQSKDIFKLRLYFAEHLTLEQTIDKLAKQQDECKKLLIRYITKVEEYNNTSVSDKDVGDFLLLRGAISRLEAHISWLDESMLYVKNNKKQ